MQRGDLVKLAYAPHYGQWIVLVRTLGWDSNRYDDNSPFAQWKIINLQSGKRFSQIARELEVVSSADR